MGDLPAFYNGKSPKQSSLLPIPLYSDAGILSQFTIDESIYAVNILGDLQEFSSLLFGYVDTSNLADIGFGAVTTNASAWSSYGSTNYDEAYASEAGDVWLAFGARESANNDHPRTRNGRQDYFTIHCRTS